MLIRQNIRLYIRNIRNKLTYYEKEELSLKIALHIFQYEIMKKVKNVALFLSFDGEIGTESLIKKLWGKNINVYLPVLDKFNAKNLLFVKYNKDTSLKLNKLKFFEPTNIIDSTILLNKLDIIFVPLVAFNKKGYRLGMGGGFYDFILKDWQKNNFLPIGLAY
ncbi:5-formyltetrahydrofolate cyclo-ligase, partial [Buchnera aphidicola (Pemphigus obesinymphae)]|uniref:5-formyltetrahydrofolate cyclo-ligase n=1 Tax=Buchnera aphidicola TaxID=9 RepID=UPI002237E2B5